MLPAIGQDQVADSKRPDELRHILSVFRRRWVVIVFCAVLVPGAALAASLQQTKKYTASALLLFRNPGFDQQLFGSTVLPRSNDAARQAATNLRLVSVLPVAAKVAQRSDVREAWPGIDDEGVLDAITVRPEGQADLGSVLATATTPRVAALLANAYADEYVRYRRETDRSKIEVAERLIQRQLGGLNAGSGNSERRDLLESRAEELGILAALQTGNAEVSQRAEVPTDPSSPRTERNVGVGIVFGGLLGLILAFVADRLDRRFRSPEDMEELFGRPILATVPQMRKGPLSSTGEGNLEPFRVLRANLRYFSLDRTIKSLLITSAGPGEGKTTVVANLALAAAQAGDRVLVIEADLRRPVLVKRLEQPSARLGLSSLIASDLRLEGAIQDVTKSTPSLSESSGTLHVLFAGPPPPNPADILDSDRMRELLRVAESSYDLVIVDSPPLSLVPDAIPVIKVVSGVLIVSRVGRSTRDAASKFRDQLTLLDAPVLGIVANDAEGRSGYDGYSYAYASSVRDAEPAEAEPAKA